MSFRPRHDWHRGARVNGAQLWTCEHCGALRVDEPAGTVYVRRVENEDERVRAKEPPCLAPLRRPKPVPAEQQQAFDFLESLRTRQPRRIEATPEQRAAWEAEQVECKRCGVEQRAAARCCSCRWPLEGAPG